MSTLQPLASLETELTYSPPTSNPRLPAWRAPAPVDQGRPLSAAKGFGGAAIAALFGFLTLMPYFAISAGNNTAVQLGNVLTVLLVPASLMLGLKNRPVWVYPALIVPLAIATAKVAYTGTSSELSLSLKATMVWCMSLLTVIVGFDVAKRHPLALLGGLSVATILHAAMGVWQWFAFSAGYFPMIWLYQNPSFLSLQEHTDTMALYMRRPFGLFPEPSAMASSLGPWILLWLALQCGVARLRVQPPKALRMLFTTALVCGVGLIILSQSGHAAVTLAMASVFVAAWLVRARATWQSFFAIVLGSLVIGVVVYSAAIALSGRLGAGTMGNSSWADRGTSLLLGWTYAAGSDVLTAVLGMGPGLSSVAMQKHEGLEAVWSVSLTYLYETGLVGFIALSAVAMYLLRRWTLTRRSVTFALFAAIWAIGITVTTSYDQLLSPWLCLGWLAAWPSIVEPAKGWVATDLSRREEDLGASRLWEHRFRTN